MNVIDLSATSNSLNRLLKMAILAGVDAAVRLHISRGDDLNAKDADGLTPLMLAASKNRGPICALLLDSGADPALTDSSGRDALTIARRVNATQAILAIEASIIGKIDTPGKSAGDPISLGNEEEADEGFQFGGSLILGVPFDLAGWEAEDDYSIPPEENDSLSEAAALINRVICGHKVVDDSPDLDDLDALLPEFVVPLARLDDNEYKVSLKGLLLRAIREGSVPEMALENVCNLDDSHLKGAGEALLHLVLGDIGAETDERYQVDDHVVSEEPSQVEEQELAEIFSFLAELQSGRNEPSRIYINEMYKLGRQLLTAQEEASLSEQMDLGIASAVDALASWPEGVSWLLSCAQDVLEGRVDVEMVSRGAQVDADIEEAETFGTDAGAPQADSNDDSEEDHTELSDAAREFSDTVHIIRRLAIYSGKGGPAETELRDAIVRANLTPIFLCSLSELAKRETGGMGSSFQKALDQYLLAKETMTLANLRLVISIVKRYQGLGLPFEDLVQEGNIGLMKAVDRFDWRRGYRFSTYATWWIRQQTTRALADQGKMIRTPVHVHQKILRLSREIEEFERSSGGRPTVSALAERMSMSTRNVESLMARMEEPTPFHVPDDNDAAVILDGLIDPRLLDPVADLESLELKAILNSLLDRLDARAAEVLRLRFGLNGGDALTLEQIGSRFNLTRERIRQIEAKAIQRLSFRSNSELLADFLYESITPNVVQKAGMPSDQPVKGCGKSKRFSEKSLSSN